MAFYGPRALESLTRRTYDEMVEQEIGSSATPEKVISQVRRWKKAGGIGELAMSRILVGWSPGRAQIHTHVRKTCDARVRAGDGDVKAAELARTVGPQVSERASRPQVRPGIQHEMITTHNSASAVAASSRNGTRRAVFGGIGCRAGHALGRPSRCLY